MTASSLKIALRGPALTFVDDPFIVGDVAAMKYESDGLVLIDQGQITAFGSYADLQDQLKGYVVTHYPDSLILPGFIDTHVHYPQTQVIGSYGAQLIDWLNQYTFVAEQQFADPDHATLVANVFLDECLKVGTTTAAVYCTVHPQSVDSFFHAASQRNMRMIAGKVMMDRNAPAALTDTAQSGYDDSEALIRKWHGQGRNLYAITPRFAPSSTEAQLDAAGALWQAYPDTWMQTHLSEDRKEIAWVQELFPERLGYLDIYQHYGLTGPKALFGHAIYLEEPEWQHIIESGSGLCHCPTSNAFLGSGLFNFQRAKQGKTTALVGLATDVGGGTSLSMLQTMGSSYQIARFGGYSLSAPKAYYLATRGAAQCLYLQNSIGSLAAGMEADIQVINLRSTPLIDFRMQRATTLEETLFIQMIMADDRATHAVYIAGKLAYTNQAGSAVTGFTGDARGVTNLAT